MKSSLAVTGWAARLRRWWLHAAVLVVLAAATVVVMRAAAGWRPHREVSVEECIVNPAFCMADGRTDLVVVGSYVPRSYASTPECPTRVTLQSPGGLRPGKLEVCSDEPAGPIEGACDGSDDPAMKLVIANGYFPLRVKGSIEGSVLRAEGIFGTGCDSRYHAWRYGDAAVREPGPR